jgi:hypothetical protein
LADNKKHADLIKRDTADNIKDEDDEENKSNPYFGGGGNSNIDVARSHSVHFNKEQIEQIK